MNLWTAASNYWDIPVQTLTLLQGSMFFTVLTADNYLHLLRKYFFVIQPMSFVPTSSVFLAPDTKYSDSTILHHITDPVMLSKWELTWKIMTQNVSDTDTRRLSSMKHQLEQPWQCAASAGTASTSTVNTLDDLTLAPHSTVSNINHQ